jgi:hypothetical protein
LHTRIFSLRKSNFSKVSGANLPLWSEAIKPAAENNLSTSVEVGGAVRNFLIKKEMNKMTIKTK